MNPIKQTEATKVLSRKLNSHYIKAWCQEWAFNEDTTARVLWFYAEIEDPWEVIRYLAAVTNVHRFGQLNADIMTPVNLLQEHSSF